MENAGAEDRDDTGEERPTAVVTGANSGVGYQATRTLAQAGWRVVMVCRSAERGGEARERLREGVGGVELELEIADLARLADVEALAERVLAAHPRLDGLVLNAGLYASERTHTEDGWETTLAVNHLAHALLAVRLLPALAAAGGRIVAVTSGGHRRAELRRAAPRAILDGRAWTNGLTAYCDSKLANVLFAFEADRRWRGRGVRADAVHPGVLDTRIWENVPGLAGLLTRVWRLFMKDAGAGGEAVTRPLLDPALAGGGERYFDETDEAEPSADARDPGLASRWWEASLDAVGVSAPPPPGPSAPRPPPGPGPG